VISSYIENLYSNCKLFERTDVYNESELLIFFENEIQTVLDLFSLNSEKELLEFLISKSYVELNELFDKSVFLHVFYLINSLNECQEESNCYDSLGRFQFEKSIIKQKGIEKNIVLDLIRESYDRVPVLKKNFKICNHKSYFFLSHDIDSIYGSLTQDGLWALKHGRFDIMFKVIFNTMISKPDWVNFDLIMSTESEFDFKSTFYWLVNKGKIDERQTNSDYDINSSTVVNAINSVAERGFENGLHKSISNETFQSELLKMPTKVNGNRYHYLKFQLPDAYNKIEEAQLKLDASLGFAEHFGFRNGYGYPFHPYNINNQKPYNFLEVPLNIMDGTFQRYLKIPVDKTADTIIAFLEKNNENALLSILWHNTFFSNFKYKGYLNEYKKILKYLYDSKFQNINQQEIIEKFSW
jgi:hypothetical protein